MKNSPLKRKTPLKRSQIPLKKSKLSQVSKKKKGWIKKYHDEISSDNDMVITADLGSLTTKHCLERHHPFGRKGKYLLIYCYIHSSTHEKIHCESTWAREAGWLQGPYEGRAIDPDAPKPWKPGSLINEHLLTSVN